MRTPLHYCPTVGSALPGLGIVTRVTVCWQRRDESAVDVEWRGAIGQGTEEFLIPTSALAAISETKH